MQMTYVSLVLSYTFFVQLIVEEVCGPEGCKISSHLVYMLFNLHGSQLIKPNYLDVELWKDIKKYDFISNVAKQVK